MKLLILDIIEIVVILWFVAYSVHIIWDFYKETKIRKEIYIMRNRATIYYYRYLLENKPEDVDIKAVCELKDKWDVDSEIITDDLIHKAETIKAKDKT